MYPLDDEEDLDEEDLEEEETWNGHYGGGTGEDDDEEENDETQDDGEEDNYGEDIGDGYGEDENPEEDEVEEDEEQEQEQEEEEEEEIEGEGAVSKGLSKLKAMALVKRNAHKYATVMGILPIGCRPETLPCPGCGLKSVYKSKTLTDMTLFKAIIPALIGVSANIYFCMNSAKNCKFSFERKLCWMMQGPFVGGPPVPYPLALIRFNK